MSLLDIPNYIREVSPTLYYIAIFLGATAIVPYLYTILAGIVKLLFRKRLNLKQRYGQNAWALITGSSEGIGRQIATELAKQGINILLMARTQSKLKNAQSELKTQFPSIQVQYIVADLIKQGQKQNQADFLPELKKYDLSIVVNNAGVDIMDTHLNLSVETIINLININCFTLVALTHRYVKIFKEKIQKTGKKCAIINVSSVAGELPLPLSSVYSASKVYVNKLTKNLAEEHPEIDWQILRPSQVSTSMTCFKNLDIFTITAKQCAEGTINDLGQDLSTNGHISHKIQSFIYQVVPNWFFYLLWWNHFGPQMIEHRRKFNQNLKKK